MIVPTDILFNAQQYVHTLKALSRIKKKPTAFKDTDCSTTSLLFGMLAKTLLILVVPATLVAVRKAAKKDFFSGRNTKRGGGGVKPRTTKETPLVARSLRPFPPPPLELSGHRWWDQNKNKLKNTFFLLARPLSEVFFFICGFPKACSIKTDLSRFVADEGKHEK